jgi:hypothetical protein
VKLDSHGLSDLLPKGGIARGEERILASVPAEEMRGARVGDVMFPTFPDLMEKKRAGLIGAAVQIVLQAAFFLARRGNEGAEFRFEEQVLAFLGTEKHDEGEGALREFGDLDAARFAGGTPLGGAFPFWFGHIGGDCTPTGIKSNWELRAGGHP